MLIVFGYNCWFKLDTCEEYFIHVLAVCSILRKVARGGTELTYRSRWWDLHLNVFWGLLSLSSQFAVSFLLKAKVVPVDVMEAYRGSRGVAPLFLNLCII